MKRIPRENEAVLVQSAIIGLDDDRLMLLLHYSHPDMHDRRKSFSRQCIRIETRERWMRIANDLRFENPAEPFNTSMIGLPDSCLLYHCKRFIKSDMARWLRKTVTGNRVTTMGAFVRKVLKSRSAHPFLLIYDKGNGETIHLVNTVSELPEGKWFFAVRPPRKTTNHKKKIIK